MGDLVKAGKLAHLYALLAWNGEYTKEQAQQIIEENDYDELGAITYAETSIVSAVEGIQELFFNNQNDSMQAEYGQIIEPTSETYDKIILILEKIHNKWVSENPHKYYRDTQTKSDKNLFQHLPTALIGVEELSKDLMFLAPFMKMLGVDVGEMELKPYGCFKPNQQIIDAYNRYVEKFKQLHGICSEPDLKKYIKACVYGAYEPLSIAGCTKKLEKAEPRLKYMRDKIDVLAESVKKNNPKCFDSFTRHSEYE